MDIEKLIERLEAWNEQHLSVVCGSGHFACDYLCESEDCIVVQAATALSTLQAENKRLNKIVCSIPTTPDSGRTVSQYDKEMSMCAYLDDLEAENEKLRAELDEKEKYYDQMIDALSATDSAELERVKRERDAAIEYLREIEWFAGCKHFGGLDGCKKWVMGQCTEKHDLYEFVGPEKED